VNDDSLPSQPEVERSLLGAVLIDGALLSRVTAILTPEDFAAEAHRVIFTAMLSLAGKGEGIDLITVQAELDRGGHLERGGGAAYLSGLVDLVPDVEHVPSYARLVREAADRRRLILDLRRRAAAVERGEPDEALRKPESVDAAPVSLAQALAEPVPQDSYLIDGLLPEAGVALVAGESGSGKTTLVAQVGMALSVGRDVFGWSVPSAVPVAYWIGEGSRHLFLERLHAAATALGIEGPNLYVPPAKMLPPSFVSPEFEEFVERCARLGVRLIVADPLRRFFPGEENSSTAFMAGVTKPLLDLAVRYGMAFWLIHHLSKPSEYRDGRNRVRGTGALLDDVDLALRLERQKGGAPTDRVLTFDKVRHGAEPPPLTLTFNGEHAIFTTEITTMIDKPNPAAKLRAEAEKIFRLIVVNPGITHAEIASALQTRKADRLGAHKLLVDAGRIFGQQKGDGKTFGWHASTTPRQRLALEVPEGSHEVPEKAGTSPVEDEVPEVPASIREAEPGTSSTPEELRRNSSAGSGNAEPRPERAVVAVTVSVKPEAVSQAAEAAPDDDAPEPPTPPPQSPARVEDEAAAREARAAAWVARMFADLDGAEVS
jgi:hypothetical protein